MHAIQVAQRTFCCASYLPLRSHLVQPEERIPHLFRPDAPGMCPVLHIQVIGDMELPKFSAEGLRVSIVGLILICCPQEDRELPIIRSVWKDIERAILLAIALLASPDGPFSLVI